MSGAGDRLARAAARYAAHGWRVFPLAPRAKTPLMAGGRGYLDATTEPERVRAWWRQTPDANIGLWPGASGLVIVDVDGPDGEASARRWGLGDVRTLTVTTGRTDGGRHRYFRHPGFPVGNRSVAPRLDVRGDAGYVVLPPSVHPTGRRYTWGSERLIAALPPAAKDALRACQEPEPDRPARAPRSTAWTPPATPAEAELLHRRVSAYLASVGQAAQGARNDTAFRVAAMLARDFALVAEVAFQYLVFWNTRNLPPLTTRELRACMESAVRHGRRAVGAGLDRAS